jgi:hypothetical protein
VPRKEFFCLRPREGEGSNEQEYVDSVLRKARYLNNYAFKGIVSRDFVVCFLVSIDRSDISTHQEWVLLLLKVRFHVKFFDFRVWA